MELMNGIQMPDIGYGTWKLEKGSGTTEAVARAIACGYRMLDTAWSYGNEFYVARAVRSCGLPRNELFITNKLWKSFRTADAAVQVCKKSLKLMKLDYFDLYLVHWPVSITEDGWQDINAEVWSGLERLYEDGLARAIGVSNYKIHHLNALRQSAHILPMVNQIECHPGCLPAELIQYCRQQGIALQAWRPLGGGETLSHPLLRELGCSHGASPAQICLAWCRLHGLVPLPRSRSEERMRENLEFSHIALSPQDMERLNALEDVGCSGLDADGRQPD